MTGVFKCCHDPERERRNAEHDDRYPAQLGDGRHPLHSAAYLDAARVHPGKEENHGDRNDLLDAKSPVYNLTQNVEVVSGKDGAEWNERSEERSERRRDRGESSARD